jgi:hypothetical protein
MRRRGVLSVGGAIVIGSIAGCLGDSKGPEDDAKEYMKAVVNNDASKAEEMIHPESDISRPIGVVDDIINEPIDDVDASVNEAELVEKSDEEAETNVSLEVSRVVDSYTTGIRVIMRKNAGDWLVWQVG